MIWCLLDTGWRSVDCIMAADVRINEKRQIIAVFARYVRVIQPRQYQRSVIVLWSLSSDHKKMSRLWANKDDACVLPYERSLKLAKPIMDLNLRALDVAVVVEISVSFLNKAGSSDCARISISV